MKKSTKEAWKGKKKTLSPEAAEKRKNINKKILKFGCLPIVMLFVILFIIGLIVDDGSEKKAEITESKIVYNDPLGIGIDNLNRYVGVELNKKQMDSLFGEVETIETPGFMYFLRYMDSANVSIVQDMNVGKVHFIGFGKESGMKFIKKLKKERTALIGKQFSAWDGSHYKLEQLIKTKMNDPDSYEHVKTTYLDFGDFLLVKMIFRGKNGFGATVKNFVTAKTNPITGDILEIVGYK